MAARVGLGFTLKITLYIEIYCLTNIMEPKLYSNDHWMIPCKHCSFYVDWKSKIGTNWRENFKIGVYRKNVLKISICGTTESFYELVEYYHTIVTAPFLMGFLLFNFLHFVL